MSARFTKDDAGNWLIEAPGKQSGDQVVVAVRSKGPTLFLLGEQMAPNRFKREAELGPAPPMILYFDIETKPAPADHWRVAELVAKDPEYAADRTALDPSAGSVFAISYAWNEDAPTVLYDDEAAILGSFADVISTDYPFTIVGHNIEGFDLPFLAVRAYVHGIIWPTIDRASIRDTMRISGAWSRDAHSYLRLDTLCRLGGFPGKGAVSGANAYKLAAEGRHDIVKEYAANDVRRVRCVDRRVHGLPPLAEDIEHMRAEEIADDIS